MRDEKGRFIKGYSFSSKPFEKGNIPWNKGKINRILINCKTCNREVAIIKSRMYKAKYCSLKCQPKWNKGLKGQQPWMNLDGLKFGRVIGLKGQTNNALEKWRVNGGMPWNKGKKYAVISLKREDNHRMRKLFRERVQRQVFERDNYACQICGSRGNLQVDHIQSWAEYVELRFNLDNCRTLCAKCHYFITFGKEMPKTVKGWGHNLLKGEY